MKTDRSIDGTLCRLVLMSLCFAFVNTSEARAQSRIANTATPIRQTFRMVVPASFSAVSPAPIIFVNLDAGEQSDQFEPQQLTIRSQSSRGLSVSMSLDQAERSVPSQLKVALHVVTESNSLGNSERTFLASMSSVKWLDQQNRTWQTGISGSGLLKVSVSPSVILLNGLSRHDSQLSSAEVPLATITSEVTESP